MIPMLPFYARSLGASAFEIGLLMAAYSIVQFFAAPVWGRASDIYGRRKILLLTVWGQAIAFVIAALAQSFWILLLSRALAGGFGGNISTASAYMADITTPETRAKGMGLIGAAFGLGFVFGPAIGGLLIPFGYEWPSWAAAFLGFANVIAIWKVLPEPLREREQREKNRRKLSLKDLRLVLNQRRLMIPIGIFFLFTAAFVQMEVTFGLFVVDQLHFTERSAGLLLAGVGLIMAFIQGGAVGRLSQRFGEVRLILVGSAFLSVGLFLLAQSRSLNALLLSLFFLAMGYSLSNPCLMSFVSKAAGSDRYGGVMGIYQAGGSLARIISPLAAGYLYKLQVSYPSHLGGILVGIGFVIWLLSSPGFFRKDVPRPVS